MAESSDSAALRGELLETWVAFATVLEWLPAALDTPLVDGFGLTHFEYGILFALARSPDRTLRMTALAALANSSISRVSRAVTRLESRALVKRSTDPSDGRAILATLTDEGSTAYDDATPVHERTVATLVLDPLTATQRRQLREISFRIRTAIEHRGG